MPLTEEQRNALFQAQRELRDLRRAKKAIGNISEAALSGYFIINNERNEIDEFLQSGPDPFENLMLAEKVGIERADTVRRSKEFAQGERYGGGDLGAFLGWFDAAGHAMTTLLAEQVTGFTGLALQGAARAAPFLESLTSRVPLGGVAGVPIGLNVPESSERMRELAKEEAIRATKEVRTKIRTNLLGIPEDPIQEQLWMEAQPTSARMFGTLAGFLAVMTVGGGTGGGISQTTSRLGGIITSGKGASTIGRGLLTEAARGTLLPVGGGLIGAFLAPDDADAIERMEYILAGTGAGMLASSVFLGRAYGLTPRMIADAEKKALFKTGQRFGVGMLYTPTLTTGRLASAGSQGIYFGTIEAAAQGMPAEEAMMHGLQQGAAWMGADMLFARLGAARRWGSFATSYNRELSKGLEAMSPGKARALSLGTRAGLGAGLGAALDTYMTGDIPSAKSMLVGAMASTGLLMGRARSILPESVLKPLLEADAMGIGAGTKAGMTPRSTALVAQFQHTHAAEIAAMELPDAQRLLVRHALGSYFARESSEIGLRAQIASAYGRLLELESQGLKPGDPAIVKAAALVFQLRERLTQQVNARNEVFAPPTTSLPGRAARTTPTAELPPGPPSKVIPVSKVPNNVKEVVLIEDATGEVYLRSGRLSEARQGLPRQREIEMQERMWDITSMARSDREVPVLLGNSMADESTRDLITKGWSWDGLILDAMQRLGDTSILAARARTPVDARRVLSSLERRAAAIMPESVTQQAVSSVPRTLDDVTKFAAEHGMSVDLVTAGAAGRTTFRLRNTDGKSVAEADTVQGLLNEVQRIASQRGAVRSGVVLPLATTGLGAFTGTAIGMTMESILDTDNPWLIHGAAMIGAAAGGLAGIKAMRAVRLSREAEQLIKLVKPKFEKPLTTADARPLVGRPQVKKDVFWRMPHDQQIEHLLSRSAAIVAKTLPPAEREQAFLATWRKYAPFELPMADYDHLFTTFGNQARAIGMSGEAADKAWRGFLLRTVTPVERRPIRETYDLFALGGEMRGPLGSATGNQSLRSMVTGAEVLTSGVPYSPPAGVKAANAFVEQTLTKPAQHIRKVREAMHDARLRILTTEGTQPAESSVLLGAAILPTTRFLRVGQKLKDAGDEIGARILEGYHAISSGAERAREGAAHEVIKLRQFLHGTTPEDRAVVRRMLQDAPFRESMQGKNERLYEVTQNVRKWLDEWAELLNIPKGQRIEDYFPWLYTTKTLKQIREAIGKGDKAPTDILLPLGTGLPLQKLHRSLEQRTRTTPYGDMIDDPLEALMIYAVGATRKYHLDPMIANLHPKWWKNLMDKQPNVGSEMGQWYLDVLGIPGDQYIKLAHFLDDIGIDMTALGKHYKWDWIQTMADRYFTKEGAHRFPNMIRGYAFVSKLGGSLLSAITNATQLINTATDFGITNMFMGGWHAKGAIGREAASRIPFLGGFVKPDASGQPYRVLIREGGIFGDTTKRVLDEAVLAEAAARGRTIPTTVGATLVGGGVGAAAGGVLGDEEGAQIGAAVGASLGFGSSLMSVESAAVVRRALTHVRDLVLYPFDMVEVINRGVTGPTAAVAGQRAVAASKSPARARLHRGIEVGEDVATGAGAGAGVAFLTDEDPSLERILGGAAAGAAVGGLTAAGSESRTAKVLRDLDTVKSMRRNVQLMNVRTKLAEKGEFTEQEVLTLYSRMAVDQTQFRLGREARGQFLRTPMGEVAGSLQTFTFNQMEFVGSRVGSMARSMANNLHSPEGALDLRALRYMMFLTGAGATLTAVSGMAFDSERGSGYWISRIGMGLLPWLKWNSTTDNWVWEDFAQIGGPFVSDLTRTVNTVFRLATDPEAMDAFNEHLDRLAKDIIPALRQVETLPESIGNAADALGAEGLQELMSNTEPGASALANPASTVTGMDPAVPGGGGASVGGRGGSRAGGRTGGRTGGR